MIRLKLYQSYFGFQQQCVCNLQLIIGNLQLRICNMQLCISNLQLPGDNLQLRNICNLQLRLFNRQLRICNRQLCNCNLQLCICNLQLPVIWSDNFMGGVVIEAGSAGLRTEAASPPFLTHTTREYGIRSHHRVI